MMDERTKKADVGGEQDFRAVDSTRYAGPQPSGRENRSKRQTMTNKCARCGLAGRTRSISDARVGRRARIAVDLCDKCYSALRTLNPSVWQWFRRYCTNLEIAAR